MEPLCGENSMREKLVIIGNGMAPGRVLDELFDSGIDRYDITIFNAETRVNYDRIMLSPVLAGEKAFDDIVIHDDAWYARHGITLHKGLPVIDINRASKTVTAVDGSSVYYDKLLIATGSRSTLRRKARARATSSRRLASPMRRRRRVRSTAALIDEITHLQAAQADPLACGAQLSHGILGAAAAVMGAGQAQLCDDLPPAGDRDDFASLHAVDQFGQAVLGFKQGDFGHGHAPWRARRDYGRIIVGLNPTLD
jgi:hypothetical protein